jgi:hypothetical protein
MTWEVRVDYKGDEEGLKWTIDGVVEGGALAKSAAYNAAGARLARWIYDNKPWETVEGDEITFTLDEVLDFRRKY